MEPIKASIRGFLAPHFRGVELQDDQDIFSLGFVNSLFAMQLVLFIEKEFGFTVENDDLDISNFRTIEAMAKLIDRRTGGSSRAEA